MPVNLTPPVAAQLLPVAGVSLGVTEANPATRPSLRTARAATASTPSPAASPLTSVICPQVRKATRSSCSASATAPPGMGACICPLSRGSSHKRPCGPSAPGSIPSMKTKKLRSFVFVAALAMGALPALGQSAETLELQQPGHLRVAVYADFPPYSNKGKGIDETIGKELGKRMGLDVEVVEYTAAEDMNDDLRRSEERRVGKECRSRW